MIKRGKESLAINWRELGEGDVLAAEFMRWRPLRMGPHHVVWAGVSREVHGISLPQMSITTMAA